MTHDAERRSWLDGRAANTSLADSRGLAYGDGVFRTVLKYNNKINQQEIQINKLLEDCRRLELNPVRGVVETALRQAADALGSCGVLKLIVMRVASDRGYVSRTDRTSILSQCGPLPSFARRCWHDGVAAFFSDVRLAAQPRLAGIKHLNRLEQVLASRNWPLGFEEGVLCDMHDRPVCGTRSNLFWVSAGVLYTPDLSNSGVAGVTRQRILDLAGTLKMRVDVGSHDRGMLLGADEAFLSNSLIGIWPLASLAARDWPAPGPFTRRLMAALAHPWSGHD